MKPVDLTGLINAALILCALLLLTASLSARAQTWQSVPTEPTCTARHENAATLIGDSLYLVGGRGSRPLETLSLKTMIWQKHPEPPTELNHFQAVTYRGELYVLGAFQGKYPHETPLPNIYIYNPKQAKWRVGPPIPKDRLRGSAGAVVYKDKIYLVCGITDGHYDGHVAWLDEYDPRTNIWRKLPDAPHTRDHVSAVVVDDRLYLAGGRNSSAVIQKVFELTVPDVDVYDFKTGSWTILPATANIPTQRAGATAVSRDGKIWIIGGESSQKLAHYETEILDPKTGQWRTGPTLNQGRHGTQAVIYKGNIYISAGSANRGGGPELKTIEVLN